MFSNAKSPNKIKDIYENVLHVLFGDCEVLLSKVRKVTMNVVTLRTLCTEIYKSINNLKQAFTKINVISSLNIIVE